MARKPVLEGGKRDELLASARKVFMERGYDAASVRTITQACGCEVGLFYYYFKNKEQLFEQVFQQFLDELDARFAPLAGLAQRAPCRALPACAETLLGLTEQPPLPDTAQLHWSVAAALRERACAAMERRMNELLAELAQCGVRPVLSAPMAASCIARGLGGAALSGTADAGEWNKAFWSFWGLEPEQAALRFPQRAQEKDVNGWLELLDRSGRFSTPAARSRCAQQLRQGMEQGTAFVLRRHGRVVGGILADGENRRLTAFAEQPGFANRELAQRLLEAGLSCFVPGETVTISAPEEGLRTACRKEGFSVESGARGSMTGAVPGTWAKLYKI